MDAGKEILFEEKRKQASKKVIINFPTNDNNFQVLDDEGCVKYVGVLQGPTPHIDDFCKCPNFQPLNNDRWISEHGYAYQCKHLIKARERKYGVLP